MHGSEILVSVLGPAAVDGVLWITLREALPHYWMMAFPEDLHGW